MKVSIITVVFNNVLTIKTAIESVLNQTYKNIEYIIIDGASADGTLEQIKLYRDKVDKIVSEPDKGIYNAMNKGIRLATGDIIGILNADDFFSNNQVIQKVVEAFAIQETDTIFGDVQFINSSNENKIVRYYSSKRFKPQMFKYGFMPAHPSFYAKKELFEKFGYYKEDYLIAADYELLIRFLYKEKLKYRYIETPFVTMRTGGVSNKSLKSRFVLNKEIIRACKENGIRTNSFKIYSKYFRKVFELTGNN
ncbi:glycosyltransferase family 2 protein [Bacteroidota bacterium]